jgi:hypothetical protein
VDKFPRCDQFCIETRIEIAIIRSVMKSLSIFLILLATSGGAFAVTAAKPVPPAKPAPTAPAATPAPPAPAEELTLDTYINEVAKALKLDDTDKKIIESYYVADGVQMNNLLNSGDLSPLQKADQISGIRDARNAKIKVLLHDVVLEQTFFTIEARYRVALTELAADKGLIAAPPPAEPAK